MAPLLNRTHFLSWTLLLLLLCLTKASAIDFAPSGYASLTHYDLPSDYVASCGCVGASTSYPTVALNRYAYGSNTSFGPSCGLCFHLSLVSTPLTPPPPTNPSQPWGDGIYYTPSQVSSLSTPNLVVKVTDLCPGLGGPWCNATSIGGVVEGNKLGFDVHFDLAFPSKGIKSNFFPGSHDYGVWNVSYQAVSCERWAGWGNKAALGSDWAQESAACCPENPAPSGGDENCPAYYDTLGVGGAVPPNTSNVLSKGKGSSNAARGAVRGDTMLRTGASVVVVVIVMVGLSLAT